MKIEDLAQTIAGQRYNFGCEDDLQIAIASVLSNSSIPFSREYKLTATDRPDFLVGKVAIEVKVDGSAVALTRQVHRYAQSKEVDAVLVVTSRSRHRNIPREMNGKPVRVLYLNPL